MPSATNSVKNKEVTIDILYRDNDVLAVAKPAGVSAIPERFGKEASLYEMLLDSFPGLMIVHRIDKQTSGVMIFARNEEAHRQLSLQFQEHTVQKIYKAVVKGRVHPPSGTINEPIAESQTRPGLMKVHKNGKPAVTHYRVAEQFKSCALLDVNIETGRTHQIRVHMAYIGHPLLVDEQYAGTSAFYFSSIKRDYKGSTEEERPTINRLTLHAYELTFTHPATGLPVTITAQLPKDIQTLLKLLRKYDRL